MTTLGLYRVSDVFGKRRFRQILCLPEEHAD
jgi:hypothetical protein